MATLRVSGVQMSVSPKLEDNLPKILDHIKRSDADFIVFPEMSLTGYHGDFSDKATDAAWNQIATACRKACVTAIIGTGCREDGATYIQSRIYSDTGDLAGTHEKLVPTKGDREFCAPGEELRVFDHSSGLRYGCLICNDLWVTPGCGPYPDPRLAYQLGQRGAQVIFHSIASGTSSVHTPYHESNLVLRAMEGGLYIVTANAAHDGKEVNALSGVVSPEGTWLAQCPREGEHSYAFDIEVDTE
jgi:predicted amidohydrolase